VSTKLTADDDALRQAFTSLTTRDSVASLLDVTPKLLRFYLYKAQVYRSFHIPKRSGGTRKISSPANALKIIQRKLNQVLQAVYGRRSPVHGFVRKRSIKTNAQRHKGCQLILNFDLEDFFPSIHIGRVIGLLSKKPYSLPEEAALTLAQICCHNGSLPAGAPTSPIMANMVCAALDAQLRQVAQKFGCMYTRYADDITFSTRASRFHPGIAFRDVTTKQWGIGDEIKNVVLANFFKIHPAKTHVRNKNARQEVTGIRINSGLNVRRQLLRQIRAMLHAWETYGEQAAEAAFRAEYDHKARKKPADFKAVLRGKVEFAGFIRGRDDALYLKLLLRFLALDASQNARPVTAEGTTKDKVIEQAVWLLIAPNGHPQATAFAVEGMGLLTAYHCVGHLNADPHAQMLATRPGYDDRLYPIKIEKYDEVRDVAQLSVAARCPVQLAIGSDKGIEVGNPIKLFGFPRYHQGDGIHVHHGPITQSKVYNKIPHFVIDPVIFRGNSGGPVLDTKNRVIGIAVKGWERADHFGEKDELSSFVPISMVQHMRQTPASNDPTGKAPGPPDEPMNQRTDECTTASSDHPVPPSAELASND
jgi:RNA-directed DNA polymerase